MDEMRDMEIAGGLLEAPKIVATRLRAISREHLPERKAYKREYGIHRRERDRDRKHGAASREAEHRRVSLIFILRKYEDDPRAT